MLLLSYSLFLFPTGLYTLGMCVCVCVCESVGMNVSPPCSPVRCAHYILYVNLCMHMYIYERVCVHVYVPSHCALLVLGAVVRHV